MPAPIDLDELRPFRGLEVKITGSFEEGLKRFKSVVQKSQILREFKDKQSFEKPSDKKRRKQREAKERARIAELRKKQGDLRKKEDNFEWEE